MSRNKYCTDEQLLKKYNRLTILEPKPSVNYQKRVLVVCDCGKIFETDLRRILIGKTKSCGCYRRDLGVVAIRLCQEKRLGLGHCMTGTTTYKSWDHMIGRCYNKKHIKYPIYGGRGIQVCDRWRHSFSNFLEDMGEKPPPNGKQGRYTLGRIDNNGDYTPNNCRWELPKEQANNRRNNRLLTYYGETQTVSHWAKKFGLNTGTVVDRINRGWSVYDALNAPAYSKKHTPLSATCVPASGTCAT